MKIINQDKFDAFLRANAVELDKMGPNLVAHVIRWCECMEKRLEEGESFKAIQFKEDAKLFEFFGHEYPPQFMHYMTIVLKDSWEHGKELEKWFYSHYGGRSYDNVLASFSPMLRECIVELPAELENNKTKVPVVSARIPYDIIREKADQRYLEFDNDMCLDYIYRVRYGRKWCLHFSYEGVEMKVFKFDCLDTWDDYTKSFGH